jgi:hypothetical protein
MSVVFVRPSDGKLKDAVTKVKAAVKKQKKKIQAIIDPVDLFIDHIKDKIMHTTKDQIKEMFNQAKETKSMTPFTDYIIGIMKSEIHIIHKKLGKEVGKICKKLASGVIDVLDKLMMLPIFIELKPVEFVLKPKIRSSLKDVCESKLNDLISTLVETPPSA